MVQCPICHEPSRPPGPGGPGESMTRPLACLGSAAIVIGLASPASAQGLEPPPPMSQGAPAEGAAPPGYPGAPGPAPSQGGDDESADSGLGLEWLWFNADAGYAYTDLASFSASNLGMQKTASSGPVVGGGVGARLLFFTFGLRAHDLMLDMGNLWEVGAEAAFHMRVWHIDPYFGVRGGYNWIGELNSSTVQNATGNTNVAIHGFNVGPMVGIDFYLAHAVSIGADVDAQFLFMQRPPAPLPAGLTPAQQQTIQSQPLYKDTGSSAGIQITPTAHLGIHF